MNTHTHTHTPFYGLFSGIRFVSDIAEFVLKRDVKLQLTNSGIRWAGARRNLLLEFMVQGKTNSGRHTDHLAGRRCIWTNQRPTYLHLPPDFTPDALPAATLPLYRGLEQASNMLACIPSGAFPVAWLMNTCGIIPLNCRYFVSRPLHRGP